MNAQYVYLYIQRVDGCMLNMYTCTFRRLMGECSICIPVHSEGWLVNAQYIYLIIQTVDG